jgi:hypothetical protein
MNIQDKSEFESMMRVMAENFSATVSVPLLKLYFKALEPYPLSQVQAAAFSIMSTRKYTKMPTLADFIENIQGGSSEDFAEVQARNVWMAIKQYGGAYPVVFDDPVTMAVVKIGFGGWSKLTSELEEDKMNWFIKDFIKTYGAFSRQGVKEYGFLDGRYSSHVKLIGDQEKAKRILSNVPDVKHIDIHGVVKGLANKLSAEVGDE